MAFRRLSTDEIECRIASTSDKGLMLLLYKDARVDMRLLDETYGIFGWKKSYQSIDGRLYCTVSIKDPDTGEWVDKTDVGVESYTEKEKGQASDAFKRACFNWGIGRELYTAPFIWISKGNYTVNDKGSTYDKFRVTDIDYDDNGNIIKLTVKNDTMGRIVFTYPAESAYPARKKMLEVVNKHYPNGDVLQALLDTFKINTLDDMSDAQLQAVYNKYKDK